MRDEENIDGEDRVQAAEMKAIQMAFALNGAAAIALIGFSGSLAADIGDSPEAADWVERAMRSTYAFALGAAVAGIAGIGSFSRFRAINRRTSARAWRNFLSRIYDLHIILMMYLSLYYFITGLFMFAVGRGFFTAIFEKLFN